MKYFKSTIFILVCTLVFSACGSKGATVNEQESSNSNNSIKQQETEAENERLKAEKEALEKELAEKEAAEKKEKEAEEAAKQVATKELDSKKTKIADMMSIIVLNLVEDEEMDDKTYDYIVNHYDLFPAVTVDSKNAAKDEVDTNITTKHLFKNIKPYLDKMVTVSGYVVQIEEEETDYGTIAEIHILDDYDNSIIGMYMNSTGDILDGDFVTMRGVPTATYSFDNIGGGTTNAILLTVSTIQKN